MFLLRAFQRSWTKNTKRKPSHTRRRHRRRACRRRRRSHLVTSSPVRLSSSPAFLNNFPGGISENSHIPFPRKAILHRVARSGKTQRCLYKVRRTDDNNIPF